MWLVSAPLHLVYKWTVTLKSHRQVQSEMGVCAVMGLITADLIRRLTCVCMCVNIYIFFSSDWTLAFTPNLNVISQVSLFLSQHVHHHHHLLCFCWVPWAARSSNPSTHSLGIRSACRTLKEMDVAALSNRQSRDPFRHQTTPFSPPFSSTSSWSNTSWM